MGEYIVQAEPIAWVDGRGHDKMIVPERYRALAQGILAVLNLRLVKEWATRQEQLNGSGGLACSAARCPVACALMDAFGQDLDTVSVNEEVAHFYPKGWTELGLFEDFAIELPDDLSAFVARLDYRMQPLAELTPRQTLQLVESFHFE